MEPVVGTPGLQVAYGHDAEVEMLRRRVSELEEQNRTLHSQAGDEGFAFWLLL